MTKATLEKELIFDITTALTQALVTVLAPDPMKMMMNEINFAFMRYAKLQEERLGGPNAHFDFGGIDD